MPVPELWSNGQYVDGAAFAALSVLANQNEADVANKQAADVKLAAIASVTAGANTLPYFTGPAAAAVANLSPFIRTLLDDPDAAAARGTLGVGTGGGGSGVTVTDNGNGTITLSGSSVTDNNNGTVTLT